MVRSHWQLVGGQHKQSSAFPLCKYEINKQNFFVQRHPLTYILWTYLCLHTFTRTNNIRAFIYVFLSNHVHKSNHQSSKVAHRIIFDCALRKKITVDVPTYLYTNTQFIIHRHPILFQQFSNTPLLHQQWFSHYWFVNDYTIISNYL